MLKFLNKKKNNKGFTLVELVIVVAILAILVGLLAPQYTKYVEKSRKAADASNLDEMVKVVKVFAADPANELPAADYTITISSTAGSTATTLAVTPNTLTAAKSSLEAELTASIPNWEKTATKSQKWNNGAAAPINAKVTVGPDGGTSVQYYVGTTYSEGNALEKYMTTGSEKTTTATGENKGK